MTSPSSFVFPSLLLLFLLLVPLLTSASVDDNVIDPMPLSPATTATLGMLTKLEASVRESGDFRESFLFQKFKDFIGVYSKKYDNENEAARRFAYFKENMKVVEKIQAKEKGSGKYGPTKFSDLSGGR